MPRQGPKHKEVTLSFVPFVVLVLLLKKLVDLAKEILPDTVIGNVVIQVIAFVFGIALAFLFRASPFGEGITIWNNVTLASVNPYGTVIYGLAVGAGGGVLNDAIERRNPDDGPKYTKSTT